MHPEFKAPNLKAMIKKVPENRTEIAEAIGASRATIYWWQMGRPIHSVDHLIKLAKILKVSPKDLRPDIDF